MSERKIQLLRAPSARDASAREAVPRSGSGAGGADALATPPQSAEVHGAGDVGAPPSPSARAGSLPPSPSARAGSLPPSVSVRAGSLPPSVSVRAGSLPPSVSVRAGSLPPRATSLSTELPEGGAAAVWREVLLRLDDEALHQAFMRACLAEGRMTFALECYRTLERLRPGDPVAARYLAHVAKAIEIGALSGFRGVTDDPHARRMRRALHVLLALVIGILGILALFGLVRFAAVALGS
jgi:hypothetical protein